MQIKLRGGRVTKRLTGKIKLPAGQHTEAMQTKSVEPSLAEQVLIPDTGYAGLSRVTVGRVPLQAKTATPGAAAQVVEADEGAMGLSRVTVEGVPLQSKTVAPTTGTQTVEADAGYYGLGAVTVKAAKFQGKAVTPGTAQQFITPDEGYAGLLGVAVLPEPDLLAENIKKGVTIFGVTGSYTGETSGEEGGDSGGGSGGDNTGGDNTGEGTGGGGTESATIPVGGTYYVGVTSTTLGDYTGATRTLTAGDSFPTVSDGDVYVYGDYEYRYHLRYTRWFNGWMWQDLIVKNEWGCRVLDTEKETYGNPIKTICGLLVDGFSGCYAGCVNITSAPSIPSYAVDIDYLFIGCERLVDISNFAYPDGVTGAVHLFTRTALTDLSELVIPSHVTDLSYLCCSCKSLIALPTIPEWVTDLGESFRGCTALTSVGKIPASVTYMLATFADCTALTGNIEIEANPTTYVSCFAGTVEPITITGGCTEETKVTLAATATNGNVTY